MSYIQDTKTANPDGLIYARGSDKANKSRRIAINEAGQFELQKREEDVWNLASLEVATDTVKVGKGVNLSAKGAFVLKTSTALGTSSITPELEVASSGSETPKTSVWEPKLFNLVAQPFDGDEIVAKDFTFNGRNGRGIGIIADVIRSRTASVGASADISFELRNIVNGNLYFERKYPASKFSANTEVSLDLGAGLSLLQGEEFSFSWTSDEVFSLKGLFFIRPPGMVSGIGFTPWMGFDVQFFDIEEIVSFPGLDRIVVDYNGEVMVDYYKNVMSFEVGGVTTNHGTIVPGQGIAPPGAPPPVQPTPTINFEVIDGVIEIT